MAHANAPVTVATTPAGATGARGAHAAPNAAAVSNSERDHVKRSGATAMAPAKWREHATRIHVEVSAHDDSSIFAINF